MHRALRGALAADRGSQRRAKPVYLWAKDKKPGDATGEALEGFDGKWSVNPDRSAGAQAMKV